MAEKMEDLNLPQAAVLKIIKEAIPSNINVGKDVKAAVAKAASMFILFITSQSTQCAQAGKRKTVSSQDIFDALEETEFGHYIPQLQEVLKEQAERSRKGDGKKKGPNEEEEADDDDDVVQEDVDNESVE